MAPMLRFGDLSISAFLDALASPEPTPGGGTAAAVAGSIGVALLMMVGLRFIVQQTRIGKAMRATSYNLSVAKLMGINTDFVIAFTFALGSALAAIARQPAEKVAG